MKPMTRVDELSARENLISWNAVWAGVLVAFIIGLLFNLLGTAIGFSLFSPSTEVLKPLTLGTVVWFILSGILAMYAGGWVAGRFSAGDSNESGIVYGIMVSGISILLSFALMASAVGSIASNTFSALQHVITASTSTISSGSSIAEKVLKGATKISPELTNKVKQSIPELKPIIDKVNKKAEELISKAEETGAAKVPDISPEKVKKQLNKLVTEFLDSVGEMNYEEAREKLLNSLVETTGKTPEEIQQTIEEWQKMYEEVKDKAYGATLESTKKVASVISQIALVNFLILLTGLIAASIGAVNGIRNKYC